MPNLARLSVVSEPDDLSRATGGILSCIVSSLPSGADPLRPAEWELCDSKLPEDGLPPVRTPKMHEGVSAVGDAVRHRTGGPGNIDDRCDSFELMVSGPVQEVAGADHSASFKGKVQREAGTA